MINSDVCIMYFPLSLMLKSAVSPKFVTSAKVNVVKGKW